MATKRKPESSSHTSTATKPPLSLDEELIRYCCNTCVTTAHHLVETIHQHLDTAYKSSGWHCVYCEKCQSTLRPSLLLIIGQSLLPQLPFSWLDGNIKRSTLRSAKSRSRDVGTNVYPSWIIIRSKFTQHHERSRSCKR
jgi:hypothetical protein